MNTGVTMCVFVSPLVVAGIVIGLVLFLSFIIIIVGSMRKKKSAHLNTDVLSYGGSVGELRSACIDDYPPAFDFNLETISHLDMIYPDAPPQYDECVGPGATQIFIPTDDPPPYSHAYPCVEGAELGAGPAWLSAPVSVVALPLDELPPYEAVMEQQNRTIPLISDGVMKQTHRTIL